MGRYLALATAATKATEATKAPAPESPCGGGSGGPLWTTADEHLAEAKELVRTCREHGIGLRLEDDGSLVVASNGRAWRALVREIEQHVDEVAWLVLMEWLDA